MTAFIFIPALFLPSHRSSNRDEVPAAAII
jgi:hypothetical protein